MSDQHEELKVSAITSKFYIHQVLGKGAFASVYKGQYRQNPMQLYAESDTGMHVSRKQKYIALKIINVDKVAARRRKRKLGTRLDAGNRLEISMMEEDDTEQLFFPSRIKMNPNAFEQNDHDDIEIKTVKRMVQKETEVHAYASKMRHPNIVMLLESFHYSLPRKNHLVSAMIIEYCSLGDLQSYLKRKREEKKEKDHSEGRVSSNKTLIDETEARYAMRQILRGLAFLHSHGIAHRDIKPGNILLKSRNGTEEPSMNGDVSLLDCTLKIGDFGLAVKMSAEDDWDEAQNTICGTPSCLAPEVARCTPKFIHKKGRTDDNYNCVHAEINNAEIADQIKKYGQPADLWSTGCLFFAMLVGRYPFSQARRISSWDGRMNAENRVRDTIGRVVRGNWEIPHELKISDDAQNLIGTLLSLDPKHRGFARGILSAHSFFRAETMKKARSNLFIPVSSLLNGTTATSSIIRTPQAEKQVRNRLQNSKSRSVSNAYSCKKTDCQTEVQLNTKGRKMFQNRIPQAGSKTAEPSNGVKCQTEGTSNISQCTLKAHPTQELTQPFLSPLTNLSKLIPAKYQWCERNMKRSIDGETKSLHFTLYILPNSHGAVFQCERIEDGSGAFMHIIGDGSRVFVGKLGSRLVPTNYSKSTIVQQDVDLVKEAFQRRPKKSMQAEFPLSSNSFEHQTTMNSTLYGSRTTHSMPIMSGNGNASNFYKPLSRLFRPRYQIYLSLFRKVEGVISRMSVFLSKFSIHVHLRGKSEKASSSSSDFCSSGVNITCNDHNQICTITTPQNGRTRSILVSFVDGICIKYDTETNAGEIHDGSNSIGKIILDETSARLRFVNGCNNHAYSFHLLFAHEAIKKCVEICVSAMHKVQMGDHQPSPFVVVANRHRSYSWIVKDR